jgi:three-Cys-motif partner protein
MSGHLGSPLIALETALKHSSFQKMSSTELRFVFIERDAANLAALHAELKQFEPLPTNVHVECAEGDCFQLLTETLKSIKDAGSTLAPSFLFCDPYGFHIPGAVLQDLMKFPRVELFINVIWRELDMAIMQARNGNIGMGALLDSIFAGRNWGRIDSGDFDERAEQCVQQFQEMTGARWATRILMLAKNRKTRYFLLHLSNHDAGRDLMKECIWKSCPDNGFYVRQSDNPKQQFLVRPEPDLTQIRQWLLAELSSGPVRWKQLREKTRKEIWLPRHTNEVVRQLRKAGVVVASDYAGPCTESNNPLLSLKR